MKCMRQGRKPHLFSMPPIQVPAAVPHPDWRCRKLTDADQSIRRHHFSLSTLQSLDRRPHIEDIYRQMTTYVLNPRYLEIAIPSDRLERTRHKVPYFFPFTFDLFLLTSGYSCYNLPVVAMLLEKGRGTKPNLHNSSK